MAINRAGRYDADPHVAEIYDTEWETEAPEVEQILGYTAGRGPLRILDPFCGTGRILIPLARAGHELVGMDQCPRFLARLHSKLAQAPAEAQQRVTLIEGDVLDIPWPTGFDVVFLGGNCLWELGSAEEQERVIASAASALGVGGHVFLDSDVRGELPQVLPGEPGLHWAPSYTCADGTRLEFGNETVWYDAPRRMHLGRGITRITSPDGQVTEVESTHQNHFPTVAHLREWLDTHRLVPEFTKETERRATYWARREG